MKGSGGMRERGVGLNKNEISGSGDISLSCCVRNDP